MMGGRGGGRQIWLQSLKTLSWPKGSGCLSPWRALVLMMIARRHRGSVASRMRCAEKRKTKEEHILSERPRKRGVRSCRRLGCRCRPHL